MRILLVEDHSLVRQGLRKLLESEPWVGGLAEAATAEEALERLRGARFDLVVLDLSLPDHDGLWLLDRIPEIHPNLPVLVLSMHVEDSAVLEAFRRGAHGYLVKSASADELLSAAQAVLRGGSYLHGPVAGPVLRQLQGAPSAPPTGRPILSQREEAVLRCVADGLSNRQVAGALNVSVGTVKADLQALFVRFGVADRTRLVVRALESGLLARAPEE